MKKLFILLLSALPFLAKSQAVNVFPYYNVLNYGFVQDGTTDNTAAARALYAYVGSTKRGGTIYWPGGNHPYLLTDSVLVPSNVRTLGDATSFPPGAGSDYAHMGDTTNAGTSIIFSSATANLFVSKPSGTPVRTNSFAFENMLIANTASSTPTNGAAIRIYNGLFFTVNNVTIEGFYRNMYVSGGFSYQILHSQFYWAVYINLDLGNNIEPDAGDFVVDGCTFSHNGVIASSPLANIYYHGGGGMKVSNCKFNGLLSGTSAQRVKYDIDINWIDGPSSDIAITNCSMENFDSSAIYGNFPSASLFRNIVITNIQLAGGSSKGSPINLTWAISTPAYLTISNFSINDNNSYPALPAIKVTNAQFVTLGKGTISTNYSAPYSFTTCTHQNIDYMWSNQLLLGNTDASSFYAADVQFSNTNGGASSEFPGFILRNTSTTLPAGSLYNIAVYQSSAGNGAIVGGVLANYGVGPSAPYSSGTGYYVGANSNFPLYFYTNNVTNGMINTNGNFSIGTTTDVPTALINMSSTTKGFLPPQMTTTQRNAISSPADGLEVYDATLHTPYWNLNGTWTTIGGGGGTLTGSGTSGQIALWSGTSGLTGDAFATYNITNKQITLTGGTMVDQQPILKISATMPTTAASYNAVENIQATSHSSGNNYYAFNLDLLAGATDAFLGAAGRFANAVAGTGNTGLGVWGNPSNNGILADATATTVGDNFGGAFMAQNGNRNVGIQAISTTTKNSATNIGGAFFAANAGTSPIRVGVFAGLMSTAPTLTDAALIADNGAVAAPIAIFRDNGTAVVTIADGGAMTTGSITLGTAGNSFNITEGTNGRTGQVSLVSGTKAITISGLTTSSRAFVQLVSPSGGSLTIQYQAVCTTNTLTIEANVAAGTINAADGSLLNYFVIN